MLIGIMNKNAYIKSNHMLYFDNQLWVFRYKLNIKKAEIFIKNCNLLHVTLFILTGNTSLDTIQNV